MSTSPSTAKLPAELQVFLDAALATNDRPNGITDEQIRQLFAIAGSQRNNPGFFERWNEGVAEYRHQIQEEWERELAKEDHT